MKTEIVDFWLGKFKSQNDYFDFVGEDIDTFYNDNLNDQEKFISKFAKSQAEIWIDHDLMESGFQDNGNTIFEKFKNYSYANKWADVISGKLIEINIKIEDINTVIFINKGQIKNPISVYDSNFFLEYVGSIEYEI